jgi:serine phosphatase RsbU (regulator of sigma subunit)
VILNNAVMEGVFTFYDVINTDGRDRVVIGDTMFVYTDGIIEAWEKPECKTLFGMERLKALFARLGNKSTVDIKAGIIDELKDYV